MFWAFAYGKYKKKNNTVGLKIRASHILPSLFNILIGWIGRLPGWSSDRLDVCKVICIQNDYAQENTICHEEWRPDSLYYFWCQMSLSIQAKGALSLIVLFISYITGLPEASSQDNK